MLLVVLSSEGDLLERQKVSCKGKGAMGQARNSMCKGQEAGRRAAAGQSRRQGQVMYAVTESCPVGSAEAAVGW